MLLPTVAGTSKRNALTRRAGLVASACFAGLVPIASPMQAGDDADDRAKLCSDTSIAHGWRVLRVVDCARCHGKHYTGLAAPSIVAYVATQIRESFTRKVIDGNPIRGMPGYRDNAYVAESLHDIYRYFHARANGEIGPEYRPLNWRRDDRFGMLRRRKGGTNPPLAHSLYARAESSQDVRRAIPGYLGPGPDPAIPDPAEKMAMSESINGDLSVRAVVDTTTMDWAPSPSRSVWRKRVHLVGPPESGQVTSVVHYQPGSTFPRHDHPDGEEILVLEGVFSDEHGDWPAGTFLLNPEGFCHAPFSDAGCVLFVKLRQFAGRERRHVIVDTNHMAWQPTSLPGVTCKPLYRQSGFSDVVVLERWSAHSDRGTTSYPNGAELFVLEGGFADEAGRYPAGCWLRLPAGSRHRPRSDQGCILYIKSAGLQYLKSAVT